ncbi:hypothetical protein DL95DRAFT_448272 [Leptodontidium sp. 2 PMI_412]|nr:hypothetical protein DL95DRAFT_448272 [Leptodontidium sp. 2 PMI_412]
MSPNPHVGNRKRDITDVDTTSGSLTWNSDVDDGSILPTRSSTLAEPTRISELEPSLASSSGVSQLPLSASVSDSDSPDSETALEDGIEERDGTEYITLTITGSSGTYATLVELGDPSFPTAYSATQATPKRRVQNPGVPTGTIVGIVVGIFGGVMLLMGVFYVYLLRARHLKRVRRRRRRARRASAGSGGPGPAPPPPPPAEEGAFPPANP